MAYPIQLFDFSTDEGKQEGTEFLISLDKAMTKAFGIVETAEKLKKIHRYKPEDVPEFLKKIGDKSIDKILHPPDPEKSSETPSKPVGVWRATIGIYGRKNGTMIKRDSNVLYRIVINVGSNEVYYLNGLDFKMEGVVLPNGYALLCSPQLVENNDIKVESNPIRKLTPELLKFLTKIKERKYIRSTVILDYLYPKE